MGLRLERGERGGKLLSTLSLAFLWCHREGQCVLQNMTNAKMAKKKCSSLTGQRHGSRAVRRGFRARPHIQRSRIFESLDPIARKERLVQWARNAESVSIDQ
jgi:hypothetical protein